jgi:hypothetical protein
VLNDLVRGLAARALSEADTDPCARALADMITPVLGETEMNEIAQKGINA